MSDKVSNFFSRCEHPRIIKNKYTGEPVYVKCGVCPHCLILRSDAKRNLCDYEKWNRKYCYFVTLTYNSQYVPKMALVPIEDYEFDYPSELMAWSQYLMSSQDAMITTAAIVTGKQIGRAHV